MIRKVTLTIKIKTKNAKIFHLSTLPDNYTAPDFIKIRQYVDNDAIVLKLEAEDIRSKQLLSIKNTVDDYIFSVIFSNKVLSLLEKNFNSFFI
ncbi:MAG: KEOPS complex subunit Pcc1 [Candidatus Njordarchaeota archaeon]